MDRTRKHIETARLKPSPENQILYNSRGPDHPDLRGLIESIRERGIEARLLVSRDDYIISGHNRWQAAQHLGLLKVPCEIIDIRRSDCSTDQWARLLREHNHGRTKTFDELTREALVDVTEDDILRAARDKRAMRGTDRQKRASFDRLERATGRGAGWNSMSVSLPECISTSSFVESHSPTVLFRPFSSPRFFRRGLSETVSFVVLFPNRLVRRADPRIDCPAGSRLDRQRPGRM
jgi:hypothetical protein